MAAIGSGVLSLPTANLFASGVGVGQGALKVGCNCGTAGCPGCGGGVSVSTAPAASEVLSSPSDTRPILANADGQTVASLIGAQEAAGQSEEAEAESGEGGFDPSNPDGLTDEERQVVRELQQRDREVRQHEQAHAAAAGQYAGAPTMNIQSAPMASAMRWVVRCQSTNDRR